MAGRKSLCRAGQEQAGKSGTNKNRPGKSEPGENGTNKNRPGKSGPGKEKAGPQDLLC